MSEKVKVDVYVAMDADGAYVVWDDNDDVNNRLEEMGMLGAHCRIIKLEVEMSPPTSAEDSAVIVSVPDDTSPPATAAVA